MVYIQLQALIEMGLLGNVFTQNMGLEVHLVSGMFTQNVYLKDVNQKHSASVLLKKYFSQISKFLHRLLTFVLFQTFMNRKREILKNVGLCCMDTK